MKLDIIYRYEARELPARAQPADSEAALHRLCNGHQAFAALFDSSSCEEDRTQVVQLDPRDVGLASGNSKLLSQRPYAAVLGCADARVPIELIFNEGPNDLFVLRVAGNGLGPEVLGSLNYAVNSLGDSLRLIVVLGHSGCGAITKAVEVFLQPAKYLSLAKQHALRGILDHLSRRRAGFITTLAGRLRDRDRASSGVCAGADRSFGCDERSAHGVYDRARTRRGRSKGIASGLRGLSHRIPRDLGSGRGRPGSAWAGPAP